jgi:outer membrane protein assembly factor BamB
VIYAVRDEGILGTYDLKTGATLYRQRTNATHSASPIASDGRVYLAAEGGEVIVLRAGRAYEVAARIDMGRNRDGNAAIANHTLYVRTAGQVYAIGKTAAAE